jgi:hypothetical protein
VKRTGKRANLSRRVRQRQWRQSPLDRANRLNPQFSQTENASRNADGHRAADERRFWTRPEIKFGRIGEGRTMVTADEELSLAEFHADNRALDEVSAHFYSVVSETGRVDGFTHRTVDRIIGQNQINPVLPANANTGNMTDNCIIDDRHIARSRVGGVRTNGNSCNRRIEDYIVSNDGIRYYLYSFAAIPHNIAFDHIALRAAAIYKNAGIFRSYVGVMNHVVANGIRIGAGLDFNAVVTAIASAA